MPAITATADNENQCELCKSVHWLPGDSASIVAKDMPSAPQADAAGIKQEPANPMHMQSVKESAAGALPADVPRACYMTWVPAAQCMT